MKYSRASLFACNAGLLPALALFLLAAVSASWAEIDLNHDGLGDIWQLKYGANGLPAQGDADGDGMTNAQEAAAGTDPFSAASKFRIKSVTADAAGFHVVWTSVLGKQYQVQSASSLGNPNWQNEGTPVNGTGGDLTCTTGTAAAAGRFFRVAVQDVFSTGDGVSDWEKIQLGFDPLSSHNHGPTGPDDLTWITSALGATDVVTATASVPSTTKSGTEPGKVVINRNGNLDPIKVIYRMLGSAVPGVDYLAPTGTLSLPLGVNSAEIDVAPLAATSVPSVKSAVLALSASSAYTLGTPSTATILISDPPQGTPPAGAILITQTNGGMSSYAPVTTATNGIVVQVADDAARLALTSLNNGDTISQAGRPKTTTVGCVAAPSPVRQVSTITFENDNNGNMAGGYVFLALDADANTYDGYWFKVGGAGSDPIGDEENQAHAEIDLPTNATASAIASAVAAQIANTSTTYDATVDGPVVTVSRKVPGYMEEVSAAKGPPYYFPLAGTVPTTGSDLSDAAGRYFTLYDPAGSVGVYCTVNGSGSPPQTARVIAFNLTGTAATASQVAAAVSSAVDADPAFTAMVSDTTVTISTMAYQPLASGTANTSGCTVTTATDGSYPTGSYVVVDATKAGTDDAFTPAGSADSDAARGWALWRAWQHFSEGESMQIGPGRYLIPKTLRGAPHQTIRGAGMDITTVALADTHGELPTLWGAALVFSWLLRDAGMDGIDQQHPWQYDGVTISDMTLDCGLDRQSKSAWVSEGADLGGDNCVIERIHATNWGSRRPPGECFVLAIGSASYEQRTCRNAIIRECVVDQPASVPHADGTSAIAISGWGAPIGYEETPPVPHAILASVSTGTTTTITTSDAHAFSITRNVEGLAEWNYIIEITGHSNPELNGKWTLYADGDPVFQNKYMINQLSWTPQGVVSGTFGRFARITGSNTFTLPIATTGTGTGGMVLQDAGWTYNAKIMHCIAKNVTPGQGSPTYFHGAGLSCIVNGEIAGCTFSDSGSYEGVYQDTGNNRAINVHDNVFANSILLLNFGIPHNGYGLTIQNNWFLNSRLELRMAEAANTDIVIKNNYIYAPLNNDGTPRSAIYCVDMVGTIQDNIIDNAGTDSPIMTYGVTQLTRGNNRNSAGALLAGEPGNGASNLMNQILNSTAYQQFKGLTNKWSKSLGHLSKRLGVAARSLRPGTPAQPSK